MKNDLEVYFQSIIEGNDCFQKRNDLIPNRLKIIQI